MSPIEGASEMQNKMLNVKLLIAGFDAMNKHFIETLIKKYEVLQKNFKIRPVIVAIIDPALGCIYDGKGFPLHEVLCIYQGENVLLGTRKICTPSGALDLIRTLDYDIMVEMGAVNMETGEPSLSYIKEAIKSGHHVVTSNKGPILVAYRMLSELAEKHGVALKFESSVMDGIPIIRLIKEGLAGDNIRRIDGIFDAGVNYVLSKMENGESFDDAVFEARQMGFLEADPYVNLDGWDSAIKAVILANVLMNADMRLRDVEREGISCLTRDDMRWIMRNGRRIRLITRIWRENGKVRASVKPELLEFSEEFAYVTGYRISVSFTLEAAGKIVVMGSGMSSMRIAQAILSDVISICMKMRNRE